MSTNHPSCHFPDAHRTREQLIAELSGLRRQLAEAALDRRHGAREPADPDLEQFFRLSLDLLAIASVPDGRWKRVNPAYCKTFGWSEEELLAIPFLDFVHPEDRARTQQVIAGLASGETLTGLDNRVRCKDGAYRWIAWNTAPHPAGGLVYCIGRDITDRKKTEQILSHSEERFKLAARAARIGAYSRNFQSGEDFWSPEFQAVHGFGPDRPLTLQDGIPTAVHAEDRERVVAEVRSSLGDPDQSEFSTRHRIVMPDGEIRWVLLRGRVEFDAQGRPLQRHGVVMDITEREQEQQALRESEERFRLLFEQAVDGIYVVDVEGRLLDVNLAGCQQFGYRREELIGRPLADLVTPEEVPRLAPEIDKLADGRVVQSEWSLRHKEGSVFTGEIVARKLPDGRLQGILRDITERRRAEASLRESEERFRIMADGLPHIVWVNDAEGRLQFVNRTFLELFGVTLDEVKGGRWQRLLHPDDRQAHAGEFLACTRERRPFHSEVRVRRGDGQWIWVESWGRPRWSPSGEYLGFVGTSADISERKRIEETVRNTEARYRMLFDTMDEAFAIKEMIADAPGGVDFLFVEANPAFEKQTGLRDVVGNTMRQLMPGIEPRWLERYAEVVRTGERIRFEDRVADLGRWFQVLCWRIEGGGDRRVAILATDISERKKAEEARRIAYDRLQTLFDHRITGIGIVISTAQGKVIQANDYLLKIFDRTREELLSGRVDWRALTPPEWLPADERALQQLTRQGIYDPFEKEYVRRDGSRVPVLITGVTMPGNSGEIVSFVLDISERKRYEASLHRLNITLEQRVVERTALAEARALQLQALAVELIEAEEREKQRIAALLHDDLQQVLAAARLQLEAVREELPQAAGLSSVERMLADCISKARQLSHELSPAVLHQLGLAASMKKLCQHMHERFGLTVRLEADAAGRHEYMPLEAFVFRAVQELLFNIVKHAGVKEATVVLSRSAHEIAVTVSDNGRGFDPAVLDSLPEKVGLGLLSLRERASYVGGCLTVESTPGKGSRFMLTLPLDLAPAEVLQQGEAYAPFTPFRAGMTRETGGIRVLFADDHKVMRQGLIQLTADQPDIRIVGEATNGREALELARRLRPDVIVMDISMPVMDGIEATRRIRAELPEVRVIGLSMFEDEHTSRAMRDAGAEAFVSKSASSSDVLKAIYGREKARSKAPAQN